MEIRYAFIRYDTFLARYDALLTRYGAFLARYDSDTIRKSHASLTLFRCSIAFQGLYRLYRPHGPVLVIGLPFGQRVQPHTPSKNWRATYKISKIEIFLYFSLFAINFILSIGVSPKSIQNFIMVFNRAFIRRRFFWYFQRHVLLVISFRIPLLV